MRRVLMIIYGFAAVLSAQNTGTMSGILNSTSGTPVTGALVSAYLQAAGTGGGFPPVFNAQTGADGSFSLSGLTAGTYVLCAERADIALLNPCFWATKATSVTVASGASVSGVSLTAELGVPLTVLVNDPMGLLASNPTLDDLIIAVRPATSGPALPAQLISKNSAGKTLTVLVPQGKPAAILIYSAKLSLSDNQGDSFSTPNVAVTVNVPNASSSSSPGTGSSSGSGGASPGAGPSSGTNAGTANASAPTLTVNIEGQTPKP